MSRLASRVLLVCLLVGGAFACSSSSGTDGGQPPSTQDAGAVDAGTIDSGHDAGSADAGPHDAGPMDAGPGDAGSQDAGTADAGDGGTGGACDDFSGAFVPTSAASCTDPHLDPSFADCFMQVGCKLTLASNATTLTGQATGSTFTVSGDFSPAPGITLHEECTGTKSGTDSIHYNCTYSTSGFSASCDIPDARTPTPKDAASVCCDPLAQTCGANDRCTLVTTPSTRTPVEYITACLPTQGMGMESETCTQMGGPSTNGLDPGYDTCAPGLFCSAAGRAAFAPMLCRTLCQKSPDCPADHLCFELGDAAPRTGICILRCDPFGSTCTGGTTCRETNAFNANGGDARDTKCDAVGALAVGATCQNDEQCGAFAGCYQGTNEAESHCRTMCDMGSHPCSDTTQACQLIAPMQGGTVGFCAPK